MNEAFETLSAELRGFSLPRYERLPEIQLYMDQLTGYLNNLLAPLAGTAEPVALTKSMVNNYVKQGVLEAPVKKRYTRGHLAALMVLCLLKQVFSIPECVGLLALMKAGRTESEWYDDFCTQLENALHRAFGADCAPMPQCIMRRVAEAVAGKVYLQKCLLCESAPAARNQEKAKK